MNLVSIASAVVWVDFFTVALHKSVNLGSALDTWYAQFGMVAVLSDCLVIVLGILLAQLLFKPVTVSGLVLTSIGIQMVHDVLFYLLVILPIPAGHNSMIDLFKRYATENNWKILAYDALMIGSTVLLASYLTGPWVPFIGLLGLYGLSYIIYTENA
jgi:uncharacterized protein YacL